MPRRRSTRRTFQYVGADGDYVTGSFGKVQLVDGKRNDKLSVHVRRLARKATYVFRLEPAPKACAADAPGGTPTSRAGSSKPLKTNGKGVANAKATSRSFTALQDRRSTSSAVYRTTATGGGRRARAVREADHQEQAEARAKPAKHAKPKHDSRPRPPARRQPSDNAPGQSGDSPATTLRARPTTSRAARATTLRATLTTSRAARARTRRATRRQGPLTSRTRAKEGLALFRSRTRPA